MKRFPRRGRRHPVVRAIVAAFGIVAVWIALSG
jgi:hypothetical protein